MASGLRKAAGGRGAAGGAGRVGGGGEGDGGKEIKHSHKSSKLTFFELCMAINPTKISPFTI